MEQRLSLVTLGVGDLARAERFYAALGWSPSPASGAGEVVFCQLPAMVRGRWRRAALAADAGLQDSAPGAGFGGMALAYNTRSKHEVAAVLAAARAAGGRIARAAEDKPWGGHGGYFSDPDGHLWEVAWNPFWTVAADGAITLRRP